MRTETINDPDGSKSLTYFDDNNNEIKVEDYDPSGNLIISIERKYNEIGSCSGWNVKDGKGNIIKSFQVKYDSNGNEIETLQFDNEGNLEERFSDDV